MEQLRGHISGLAIPHLVIDTPGGMGKVTIGPDYVVERGPERWVLRNYEGQTVEYPQAPEADATCAYDDVYFGVGSLTDLLLERRWGSGGRAGSARSRACGRSRRGGRAR